MAISQIRSKRKPSGGRVKSILLKKRQYSSASKPTSPKIDVVVKTKVKREMGGSEKHVLLRGNIANVSDGKKIVKATISKVVENPANRNFVRRNILTRGTVVETSKGKAVITNRPGQEGFVNARLI